ncbi:MAG: flagellar basal-body rod protein FlgF [Pirellulales bacterium]|nr:flagellar basal-body rod protein FlgF [Pirellulales bacterium]
MPYGLYISAEGANAQSMKLEAISNNLANVDTVGFKRELAIFQARYAEAIAGGAVVPGTGALEDLGGGVEVKGTKTDFSAGPLKNTKNPGDLAISGEGFFQVQKGEEKYLTRAGNFQVTARGELITPQGYPVLNDSGQPVVLNPDEKTFEINDAGELMQKGSSPQKLALVKPESLADLVKQGENLFRCPTEVQPVPDGQRRVAAGFLEGSAVKPALEMTAMIEASRIFEANVNMIKTQDQTLGSLISQVLRV